MKTHYISLKKIYFFTIFLAFLLLFLISIGLTWNAPSVKGASDPVTTTYFYSIQVKRGDHLWGLAQEFKPDNEDIRLYIKRIQKLNDLDNDNIYAGDYLIFPIEVTLQK